MNVKTTDWHYRLANYGATRLWQDQYDFCTYCKYVFKGLMSLLFTWILIVSAIGYGLAVLYEIARWILYSIPITFITQAFFGTIAVMAVFALCAYMVIQYDRLMFKVRVVEKEPTGFVSHVYKRFKEKTCFMVKIDEV